MRVWYKGCALGFHPSDAISEFATRSNLIIMSREDMFIDRNNQSHTPQKCLCSCEENLDNIIVSLYDNHKLGTFEEPSIITCPKCQAEHEVSYTGYYGYWLEETYFRFDEDEYLC